MEKHLIYDFTDMRYAREPVIRRLRNGTLICSFLTGGASEPRNENVVMLSKSLDDGKTWTKPKTIASHPERGCWATEIFTETERPFMVVHTYNTNDHGKEHYRELQTFRLFLTKDGEPDGEPVSFTGGLNGVSLRQGIVMSNGEWLFPLYWQEVVRDFDWNTAPCGGSERYPFRCGVAVSGDKGFTFQRYGYLFDEKSLWEPNCIELEDGHIMMLMRSNNKPYLYRSDSYDYGRTWTPAAVSDIQNTHTKLSLFKIGDTVFLANNFAGYDYTVSMTKNRTHLQIRSSADGLKWKTVCKPEADGASYFYPHVCVCYKTQTVYIAYENKIQHYIAKLNFKELF